MGLIACHYRAAEWHHKAVELAAHRLLPYLDNGVDQFVLCPLLVARA
jgi:hypothetical protein